jgi:hypothetical protein
MTLGEKAKIWFQFNGSLTDSRFRKKGGEFRRFFILIIHNSDFLLDARQPCGRTNLFAWLSIEAARADSTAGFELSESSVGQALSSSIDST